MFRGKKAALWGAVLMAALASCAKDEASAGKAKLPVPRDEATPEERAQIDQTLTHIEQLTSELGRPHTFRSVPVVLTTANTYTDHPAACVRAGKEAQFILIKRSVLINEAELAQAGTESTMFRVLLHEIGHCYFGREHEESRLYETGKTIELAISRDGETDKLEYPVLDATVMVPEELTAPIALERYYVSEILGLARAKSVSDLAAFGPVKLVDPPTPEQITAQP